MAKNKKPRRPIPVPASEWLTPLPNDEDVRAMRDPYRERTGKEIGAHDAREVLVRIVRFQWTNVRIDMEELPPSGPVPLKDRPTEDSRRLRS